MVHVGNAKSRLMSASSNGHAIPASLAARRDFLRSPGADEGFAGPTGSGTFFSLDEKHAFYAINGINTTSRSI